MDAIVEEEEYEDSLRTARTGQDVSESMDLSEATTEDKHGSTQALASHSTPTTDTLTTTDTPEGGSRDESPVKAVREVESREKDLRPISKESSGVPLTPHPFDNKPYEVEGVADELRKKLVVQEDNAPVMQPSGQLRRMSPRNVNVHQFYPDLPLKRPRDKSQETILEDDESRDEYFGRETPGADSQLGATSRDILVVDHSEDPQSQDGHVSAYIAASKNVHFEEGREVAQYEREDTDMTFQTYSRDASFITPAQDPTPLKSGLSEEDVFSTEVDEDVLEAAKQRSKDKSDLFEPEKWGSERSSVLSMNEVVDTRANEHFGNGLEHLDNKDYAKATVSFNKAINLQPREVKYYVHRAEAFLHLTDYQSAILNYKKACVLNPDNFSYYSRLAFIYYFQGQCLFDQKLFPEALEAFSRAAEMRPEVVGYHTRSIACLAALQRHGECLALVNKRLETDNENADLYIMRARLHELFRNTTLCYYDVKDALALDPVHPEGLKLMDKLVKRSYELKDQAMQLHLMGRHRDALQKVSVAIETNPSVSAYHVFRGALHRKLQDFNSAIDDYLLALDKTDHNEESEVYRDAQRQLLLTYNDFAVECFTKGYFEEAIILLNKAIKGEKSERGLYINRGDCFFRQGNLAFAMQDYHQALEMEPTDDGIRSRIAVVHNEHAIQEYQDKNFQEAESRFTLAIQHNPTLAGYYISRCRCRQMMENVTAARRDILLALHLDPQNDELIGILSRMFPGKSIKDVMHSKASQEAKDALGHLVTTAQPIRLAPLQSLSSGSVAADEESEGAVGGTIPPSPREPLWQPPGPTLPRIKSCMEEEEFNIKVAKDKARVSRHVKDILQNRQSLKYTGSRLGAPAPPKNKLAVKPTGWRKFNLGLGLSTVPD